MLQPGRGIVPSQQVGFSGGVDSVNAAAARNAMFNLTRLALMTINTD